MREILFRGKTINNKLSVEGFYYIKNGKSFILDKRNHSWEVIPESVREFTGYFDTKNKRKVFEGDLYEINGIIKEVKFMDSEFNLIDSNYTHLYLYYIGWSDSKFLGTRFDNPELVEK